MKIYQVIAVCFIMALVAHTNVYAGFVTKQHMLTAADSSSLPVNHTHSAGYTERVNAVNTIIDLLAAHDGTTENVKHKDTRGWEGIVAICCGAMGFFTFGITGIAAIVFGAIGMAKYKKNKGLAIAGLVLGILSVLFFFLMLLLISLYFLK